jgi:hypothetical protein
VDGADEDAVMTRRELGFLIVAGCLYLTGFGFLTGMVVERVRFDKQRGILLQHLAATQERLHTHLMDLERQTQLPLRSEDAALPGGQR